MKKEFVIKPIMRERIATLIKYVEQKINFGETLTLKRREIIEVIGISEGDSAKAIIKILKEYPEEYSDKVTLNIETVKNVTQFTFGIADANVFVAATSTSMYVFKNVLKLGNNNKILTYLTAKDLVDMWNEQIITYNPTIQRGVKEVVKNGEIVEEHICSEKNINEIAHKLNDKNYCTDTITLNASNCKVEFNGNECMIIKDDPKSEFNILDGQHRTKGCLKLYEMIKEVL